MMQAQNIKKPKYKYEAPLEIFQKIQKEYLSKNKKSMLFEPIVLKSIYKELQEKEIYLTSFISQGKFGAVFEALYKNELVAIKCMQVDLDKIKEEQKIIGILKDTPYVFKQIKEIKSSDESKYFQISKKYQCSLQDIMEDLFRKKKTLPLNQIIGFALQMSSVFENMQTNKILHSDIKPENILYDSHEKSFNLCKQAITFDKTASSLKSLILFFLIF